jgi:hypothetical protein
VRKVLGTSLIGLGDVHKPTLQGSAEEPLCTLLGGCLLVYCTHYFNFMFEVVIGSLRDNDFRTGIGYLHLGLRLTGGVLL